MFQHQHDSGLIEFQGDVQQENREDDDISGQGEAAPNMLSTLMKTSRIHGSIPLLINQFLHKNSLVTNDIVEVADLTSQDIGSLEERIIEMANVLDFFALRYSSCIIRAAQAFLRPKAKLSFFKRCCLLVPTFNAPRDIQTAAACVAVAFGAAMDAFLVCYNHSHGNDRHGHGGAVVTFEQPVIGGGSFVDEDMIFNMPNVLANMAEGMLLSPPRLDFISEEMETGNSIYHELWNYRS
ncbi:hypothetical protein Tco_1186270 [Tanacetum coccineum]